MITSYNVVSADGYIADKDWNEEFIPDSTWKEFVRLINDNDAVIFGKKTYEIMYREYSQKIISEFEQTRAKKVIVSGDTLFNPKEGYVKAESPEGVLRYGDRLLLSGGPTLNESFLKAGLIDKFIRLIIPVNLGGGITPFPEEPKLFREASEKLEDGTILETYSLKTD